jgi:hypothetical protein
VDHFCWIVIPRPWHRRIAQGKGRMRITPMPPGHHRWETAPMADPEDVRRVAETLPEVVADGLAYQVRGKSIAWTYLERVEPKKPRVARPDVLAVRVSGEEEKQTLLAAEPDKFFTDDHYNGYPAILVRLAAIDVDELTELLTDAWRVQAPRKLVKEFEASSPQQH